MKRVLIFLLTNIAVIAVISIILSIFNIQPYLSQHGLNYTSLLIYAAVIGFTGSFISLFISKWMAKFAYGVKIIEQPKNDRETWIKNTIADLAKRMNIGMPEVGIYDSPEPNAFATGWNRNNALVAVSSGLLDTMDQDGVEGVLGHEMSHVSNGDMVTLTLIQGVVNTFVIFFARIAAYAVTQALRGEDRNGSSTAIYYITAIVFQIIFGILATMIVMWFSRLREFRADSGSAKYVGKDKMIKSLESLKTFVDKPHVDDDRAPSMAAFKISGKKSIMALFASHPPLEDRIKALKNL